MNYRWCKKPAFALNADPKNRDCNVAGKNEAKIASGCDTTYSNGQSIDRNLW